MSKFSSRLKEVRATSGKKQREVAEYLGIQLRSYQAYEGGGREPDINGLVSLANFFDVPLDYLMCRKDEK